MLRLFGISVLVVVTVAACAGEKQDSQTTQTQPIQSSKAQEELELEAIVRRDPQAYIVGYAVGIDLASPADCSSALLASGASGAAAELGCADRQAGRPHRFWDPPSVKRSRADRPQGEAVSQDAYTQLFVDVAKRIQAAPRRLRPDDLRSIAETQHEMRSAADQLDAVVPPSALQAPHDEYIEAVRDLAQAFLAAEDAASLQQVATGGASLAYVAAKQKMERLLSPAGTEARGSTSPSIYVERGCEEGDVSCAHAKTLRDCASGAETEELVCRGARDRDAADKKAIVDAFSEEVQITRICIREIAPRDLRMLARVELASGSDDEVAFTFISSVGWQKVWTRRGGSEGLGMAPGFLADLRKACGE